MSQSNLLSAEKALKAEVINTKRLKVTVPKFDISELIEGYSKTLIGRCMNPRLQDMKSLLYMLPRIRKIEERIVRADLGSGRFQMDFDREEDIQKLLKMEPFHFDYWMDSLVRWQPVSEKNYPLTICF